MARQEMARCVILVAAMAICATTAVAENHMSESGDGDNLFGDIDISGNKCLSSSERMEMDYGPCGKIKMALGNGVCAKDQKSLDDAAKLLKAFVDAFAGAFADEAGVMTISDCTDQGKEMVESMCEGLGGMAGKEIKTKDGLNHCDVFCANIKKSSNRPSMCLSDADCPAGMNDEIPECCSMYEAMAKDMCDISDADLTAAKSKFPEMLGCSTDAKKCWSASSIVTASPALSFVMALAGLAFATRT